MGTHTSGAYEFYDKVPLKTGLEAQGVRVVPPGTVRYGSHLERGCVVMPGYVNIGAYVGAGSMVAAAEAVYVPPGEYDEFYAFMSGGFSGNLTVMGLPSGRLLKQDQRTGLSDLVRPSVGDRGEIAALNTAFSTDQQHQLRR